MKNCKELDGARLVDECNQPHPSEELLVYAKELADLPSEVVAIHLHLEREAEILSAQLQELEED